MIALLKLALLGAAAYAASQGNGWLAFGLMLAYSIEYRIDAR